MGESASISAEVVSECVSGEVAFGRGAGVHYDKVDSDHSMCIRDMND